MRKMSPKTGDLNACEWSPTSVGPFVVTSAIYQRFAPTIDHYLSPLFLIFDIQILS